MDWENYEWSIEGVVSVEGLMGTRRTGGERSMQLVVDRVVEGEVGIEAAPQSAEKTEYDLSRASLIPATSPTTRPIPTVTTIDRPLSPRQQAAEGRRRSSRRRIKNYEREFRN